MGGWQLLRQAGSNETAFKFHRSVKIDGGSQVTVWSADSGATHEPPGNILMKQQKWFIGDNMQTQLLNTEAEVSVIYFPCGKLKFYIQKSNFSFYPPKEVAATERVRHQVSSHASRHREAYGGEELYHQQVRPASSNSSVGVCISMIKQSKIGGIYFPILARFLISFSRYF